MTGLAQRGNQKITKPFAPVWKDWPPLRPAIFCSACAAKFVSPTPGRSSSTADTSTWIALLEGESAPDTQQLARALADRALVMPPPVLAELLSDPSLPPSVAAALRAQPTLDLAPEFWQRAGQLRARVLAQGRRARLADALIAQCCVDRGVALITRDHDFTAFAAVAGLELATE